MMSRAIFNFISVHESIKNIVQQMDTNSCFRFPNVPPLRHWSQESFDFVEISCGDPGTPRNSAKLSSDYLYDSVVKYNCLAGFSQVGGSSFRTCRANKTWSGSDIRCEIASCGDPGAGINAIKNGSIYTFGASVKYSCKAGHHPVGGSEAITCEATKTWSRESLKCASGVAEAVASVEKGSDTGRVAGFVLGGFAAGAIVVLLVVLIIYVIKGRRQTRESSRPSGQGVVTRERNEKPVAGKTVQKRKASRTTNKYENAVADTKDEDLYEVVPST